MPYRSKAQAAYFNANKKELEAKGVDVDEWNESSRGKVKKLPKKVKGGNTEISSDSMKGAALTIDRADNKAAKAAFVTRKRQDGKKVRY
jgi:hypothetical protein